MRARWIGVVGCGLLAGAGAVGGEAPHAEQAAPAARMIFELPLPTTRSSASIAPEGNGPSMPPTRTRLAVRASKPIPVREAAKAQELPPLPRMEADPRAGGNQAPLPPLRPRFEQPERMVIPADAPLMPRIPELLPNNRRARRSGKQLIEPAEPVTSAAAANLEGTSQLAPLPPLLRKMQVEIAPTPGLLPFDQTPFVQSEAAPDDEDAPARDDIEGPARPPLK